MTGAQHSPADDGTRGAKLLAAAGAEVGAGVRAWLGADVHVGNDVRLEDDVTLVADQLHLGDGARIGTATDIRSARVEIGDRCELLPSVSVLAADSFVLGAASRIEGRVSIVCRSFRAGKLFYFGHDSSVGYGGTTASSAHVRIGDRVALGPHNILNANLPIELGDQVGSGCYLSVWTHGFHFGHRLSDGFQATFEGVRIEPNVWLGFHVSVLPGVTIGANTILAAGAVAARDLPADVLAGGVPARPLRPIVARRLDDRELRELVMDLLDSWCDELTWKGVEYHRTGPGEISVRTTRVQVRDAEYEPSDFLGEKDFDELVLLSLDDRLEAPRTDEGTVVFQLRTGHLLGSLSLIAHDLRDFLRRHALPCGDEETFRGLPSAPFARLINPGTAIG
ncbi:hypothetical protein [Nocardia sp. bgisy118]|uniref:acyltransferase n=1 Tax=Nocardia sp. bgisy118 TaxID=3413786 RepID=UPI003F4A1601